MKEIIVEFYKKEKKLAELECIIAKNIFEKTKGLMYKEKLEENKGMLFSFYLPWIRTFWMKNVKIPLDIIFVDKNHKIIKIYEASVEKTLFHRIYWSRGFCKYVIETNMGFCKKNDIKKNHRIDFI